MKSLALISCLQKLQYLSFVTTPKWWVCSILQPFYMLQNYPGWLNCQQLSSRLCSATLGQVWILWEPAIGSSRPSLCNYKIHNYTFAILQNTANGFLHQPLKMSWYLSILSSGRPSTSQNVWISLILWAVAGWWGWVMSHPEQRPSPASPHPALSFVVFQNREQQHLSSSLPHSPGTNVVWFTCGWISCCADKIFILMAWPLTYFGAFLSQSVETICCDPWEPGSRGRGRRGRA